MTRAILSAVALVAFLATTFEPADARVKGPRFDSLSAGCGLLQDKADALIREYKNASNDRREAILQELRVIGGNWRDSGCQAVFGNITRVNVEQMEHQAPLTGGATLAPDEKPTSPSRPPVGVFPAVKAQ